MHASMSAGYSPNTSKNRLNCLSDLVRSPSKFVSRLPAPSYGLLTRWICAINPQDLGNIPPGRAGCKKSGSSTKMAGLPRRQPAAETPNVKKLSGRRQRRGCEAACRSGPARRDDSAAAIACSKLPTLTHGPLVTEQLVTFAV